MKSFFSRLTDIPAGSSKPTKESSYKFWIPSNTNAERSPPKPIPVHPDVAALHGEKRSRALKSTHPPKLYDLPTVPIETQAIHTNDMSRQTTRPNLGSSYPQNYSSASSRTPRPYEPSDTKYQIPSRGPAYPTGTHTFRETSTKTYHGGRHESAAPVPREIWLPPTMSAASKQGESQTKLHGTSGKEQLHDSGDDRDRVERREKDRDRGRREREQEGGKGRTREYERDERNRAKERERGHEKEREITRAKREQDRNLEVSRRDKYTERDRREQERDSDREGEKGRNRTKDQGSRKESSNLTRGMDNDMPHDGERTKQDERSKAHHRDRTTGGGGTDNNRESHKGRDRRVEKEPERARERLGGRNKHRIEATDSEQDVGRTKTPAPDSERRKDLGIGLAPDTHAGHSRKPLRKMSNTLLNQPSRAEDGESSDSSTRPKRVQQVLSKRHRVEEGGSSSKIYHSRQGIPAEPLVSTKPLIVKATVSDDVPPTPQHMPIYLPPKESNAMDSGLVPIPPSNIVSAREVETPPRKETVNRLKSSRPEEFPPHVAENMSKPREIDPSIIRRPPSRGSAQPQTSIPSHPTATQSLKGARESIYTHRPKHSQPPPTAVHDKLQTPISSLLLETPHISTQAEVSKELNRSQERLPDSRTKKELEVDLVPPVIYKAQHRSSPQSGGAVPIRQQTASVVIPLASVDSALPLSNSDPEQPRKATHSLLQQGSSTQITPETDPSFNLQPHNRGPPVMSSNNLAHEVHSRMGNPVAQTVLGKPEPINPSNTVMQRLQSAFANENIVQDSGTPAVTNTTGIASNANEIEAVMQPRNEVSQSSIKPIERSYHQFHTEVPITRPSTAMDYRSTSGKSSAVRPHMINPAFSASQDTDTSKAYPLLPGWQDNVISPNTLPNQEKNHATTASSVDIRLNSPSLKNNQSRSNGQESVGIAITRPSTTTGFRQKTSGKNLGHHITILSHSDVQNSIGISIPRPSTATAIKQSSSGHSSRQPTSNKLNSPIEEVHLSSFSGPSRHDSIPATSLRPITLPIPEKGPGFPATGPSNMTPSQSTGPSLSRGHLAVLPTDVTIQQDIPGFQRQGHTNSTAALNTISPPENFTSQASMMPNPKPDSLRNLTPLTVSIPTSNDDLIKLHSASMSTHRGASDHSIAQNSHQVFKEDSIVPQRSALPSANNDSTENVTPTYSSAKVSNSQPSSTAAPQVHIRRPHTSLTTRNNSVPSTLPNAAIAPQIQIHHLITTTGPSESPHTNLHADASTLRIPGPSSDLESPDAKPRAAVNVNVLPVQLDQPQDSGNKLHTPVHFVPISTPISDGNDLRPSINDGTLPLLAEGPRSSHQPDHPSSGTRTKHDSVQNLTSSLQMNNEAQDSPSLGFFNNTFSEALRSPILRQSGQGNHPTMKVDGKIHGLRSISVDFETDKYDGTDQTINIKTSEPLVNRDVVKNVLPKEQSEVPLVERLITRKDLQIDIHSSKTHVPSEVSPPKCPPTPSQSRIQHPGLAEILSSSSTKDQNNANSQSPSSSTALHQPTTSTVFSKSGSSPKLQGLPDKQRLDDKLASPKLSPSRQLPPVLRHKEVEQRLHESPKRHLQQTPTPTPTSRSAHLQSLLSDPHGSDSLNLTPSNILPSSLHPSHTTSSVREGVTRPSLETMPHVYSKKAGQSSTANPEVPISTGGLSQVEEELASRKIRPPSIVDSKLLGNSIPHSRAITPLRESTPTTRHQHSVSLPVHLVPLTNVPSADGPVRSAAQAPSHHRSTSQTKTSYARPPGSQTLGPNITHAASASEETVLMTPSSLAHSVMLKPTVSRQSVTPSMASQTARKGTGLFTMFRSKTPTQPPPQYEIWHPNTSSSTAIPNVAPSGTMPSFTEKKRASASATAPTPVRETSVPTAIERTSPKLKIFTPFRYLTTKRTRAVSLVSVEAQDGTAPSTIVGSPTASTVSQAPFQPPPVRDAMQATEEWRNKEEAETYPNGKLRRQRPGVVFDVAEERPEGDRQRPKRTRTRHRSSSKK